MEPEANLGHGGGAHVEAAPNGATPTGIGRLAAALAKAQAAFKPITAKHTAKIDSEKGSYSYQYADLADYRAATVEALAANGLALVQPLDVSDGVLWVVTQLLHVEGGSLVSRFPVATLDRLAGQRPQALGSLITYSRRYSYAAMLALSAEDDDGAAAEASSTASSGASPATPATKRPRSAKPAAAPPASTKPKRLDQVTDAQVQRLWAIATDVANRMQVPRAMVEAVVREDLERLGFTSTRDLTPPAYETLCTRLEALDLTELARAKREAAQSAPAPSASPDDVPPPEEPPCPFD